MHTVAYVFRRVPGMSIDEFRAYYRDVHGPLMVDILKEKGLVAYDHYPIREPGLGDEYVPDSGPAYDAISIYTFETAQQAADAWPIEALKVDSMNFIDFDTMVMLPLTHRKVFP
ncbi:hypothetical protein CSC94_11820 [Zhengella mangrovi]|uniref:EthD domain-containing protein n=1 Tax=Zhengella mangrovi TaxID=1982044 RepID=A0A2G1QNK1_9HYPH|nr:EthD domain-containing protein [Zhengella mangrovi]PHP66788.1 hypothetical protein CSC94_11820 [Zhengella mangrovi]